MESYTLNQGYGVVQNPTPIKQDFYKNPGRKVGDFFIGMAGLWGINFILSMIVNVILMFIPGIDSNILSGGFGPFLIIPGILIFILEVVAIVYFFKKGRRFISIGAIVGFALPFLLALLLLGACFIAFSGGGF
jgi:hypothetical protein